MSRELSQTDLGKHVFVYYNLRSKVWSVRYHGKVIGHTDVLRLDNVILKVSQAGRARVLRDQEKNVHAGAYGTLTAYGDLLGDTWGGTAITYNPYKYHSFVTMLNKGPVYGADVACLEHRRVAIYGHIRFDSPE